MIKSSHKIKGIKMPPRYTDEFRMDAVKQVVENGYGIMETAERLGVHHDSLRNWIKKYQSPEALAEAKIQKSFTKIVEYFEYEKEIKKDWEINFIFHIFQEYKPKEGIFLLSYKNYKNNILTIKQNQKELKLQENIIRRDLKEKYISNIIENKSYKIELIEDF